MVTKFAAVADVKETQQAIFDCAPALAATFESSTLATSDGDDESEAGHARARPRLSEAALRAHEDLMAREGQLASAISLRSSEEAWVGSDLATYLSAHSEEDFIMDSDGISSQSSVSDTDSAPRSPPGPHSTAECQPCIFFARGICRCGQSCSYCHEHPYVHRPTARLGWHRRKGFGLHSQSLQALK